MNVKFQREIHASCVNLKPSRPNYGLIASSPPFWQRLSLSSGDCSSGIVILFHSFPLSFRKHLISLYFQPAVRLLRLDHPPSDEDCRNASRHLPTLLGRSPQRDPRPGLQIIIITITFIIIATTTIININIIIIRSATLLVASSRQRPGSSSPPDEQFCTFWERFPEKISIQNPETDNKCECCPPLNVDQVAE